MGIVITTDVFCDACANWVGGETTGSRSDAKRAREVARWQGWVRRCIAGRWVDLCPACDREGRTGRTKL